MRSGKSLKEIFVSAWGQRIVILIVIGVIMLIFEPKFFTGNNFISIMLAISVYGVMACGMLLPVLVGGIDLSIGSTAALSGAIVTFYSMERNSTSGSFIVGFLIAMLVCAVIGVAHGILVMKISIPAFVVTLATKYFLLGVVMIYTGNAYTNITDKSSLLYKFSTTWLFGAIPVPVVVFLIVAVITLFILNLTTFGRKIYAVGGNPIAARFAGIKCDKSVVLAYIFSSVAAGIGGIVLTSWNAVVSSLMASGYEGPVLLAMIIGGNDLAGGEGGVARAIFGALLVGIIDNMQTLLGVPGDYRDFVQGVIIIAALAYVTRTQIKNRKSTNLASKPRKMRNT